MAILQKTPEEKQLMSQKAEDLAAIAVDSPNLLNIDEVQKLGFGYNRLRERMGKVSKAGAMGKRFYHWLRGLFAIFFLISGGTAAIGLLIFGSVYWFNSCEVYKAEEKEAFIQCLENESASRCDCERAYLYKGDRSDECD